MIYTLSAILSVCLFYQCKNPQLKPTLVIQSNAVVQEYAEKVNLICPVSTDAHNAIVKAEAIGDSLIITYKTTYDDELYRDTATISRVYSHSTHDIATSADLQGLREANAIFIYRYMNPNGNLLLELIHRPEEYQAYQASSNASNKYFELQRTIDQSRNLLPIVLANGITMTDIVFERPTIVHDSPVVIYKFTFTLTNMKPQQAISRQQTLDNIKYKNEFSLFRTNAVTVRYSFFDANNTFIDEFEINKEDYK